MRGPSLQILPVRRRASFERETRYQNGRISASPAELTDRARNRFGGKCGRTTRPPRNQPKSASTREQLAFRHSSNEDCVGWHGSRRGAICPLRSDRRHGQSFACPCHPSNHVCPSTSADSRDGAAVANRNSQGQQESGAAVCLVALFDHDECRLCESWRRVWCRRSVYAIKARPIPGRGFARRRSLPAVRAGRSIP